MSLPAWQEEPISRSHDRGGFDCGDPHLNEYLRRYARQNHESGAAKTLVAALVSDPRKILGFYSLSPASLAYSRTPDVVRRGLGRYEVPVFRSRPACCCAVDARSRARRTAASCGRSSLPSRRGRGRRGSPPHRCQGRAGGRMVCRLRCRSPARCATVPCPAADQRGTRACCAVADRRRMGGLTAKTL